MTSVMPASFSRAQKPSWRGSPGVERPPGGDRPGPEQHDPRVVVEGVLELGDRLLRIDQADVRGRIDAVLVVEPPVLLQPPVEGGERRGQRLRVVLERRLHAHAQGGQHDRRLDA